MTRGPVALAVSLGDACGMALGDAFRTIFHVRHTQSGCSAAAPHCLGLGLGLPAPAPPVPGKLGQRSWGHRQRGRLVLTGRVPSWTGRGAGAHGPARPSWLQPFAVKLSETADPDKRQMLERTLQAVRLAVQPLESALQAGLAAGDVDSRAQVSGGPAGV